MKRLLSALAMSLVLLLGANVRAQEKSPAKVSFADSGQKLGTGDSWYVQLVDINGDGLLEAYFDGAIWLNDGQGHFTRSSLSFGPPNRPAFFADLNGDGFVDVVRDGFVYLNDGRFHFSEKRRLPTDMVMRNAHLADLNGDGAIDIIVADANRDRILLNDGKANFTDTGISLGGWGQCSYAVGDINGDHIPDIYVAIPHTPPPNMKLTKDKLWLGDGRGGFTEAAHNIQVGEHRGVVLADLNGDGSLELLIGGPGGGRVYFNDGKGVFTDSGQRLGSGGVVAGDFGGDGGLDVFFLDGRPTDNGKPNTVWLNDGKGHFTDSGLRLGSANSVAGAVGDINGDGKPDVFVANVKNVITKAGVGFNEVWLNTTPQGNKKPKPPGVSFAETGQQLNRLAGRGVALGDFNGDGCLDALVVNENTPDGSGHRVYFGDCHGRFNDSGQVLANAIGFGGKPAVGDVNGDGKLDVITGRTVWLNDGKGHFEPHADLIPGSEELDVVRLADVNGDGSLDLVALVGWRTVHVYLNDGKGHFRDTGQRFGSGIIGSIALGDVDGDGTIDLVTGGWRNNSSDPCPNRVWLNDGKGNFRDSGQVFDEGDTHVHGLALGDMDGDGRLDIVLAMTTPGRAGKIYLNDGKGHFHDSGQIIGHQWAHSVALGDLDGDGHLDIFLACGEPHSGTPNEVWLNDGKGRFRDSGLRLGHAFSWDVALGDLNRDGRLDALVANLRLVDGSKNPPVFGGVPAEVWLNTTSNPRADSTDYLGQPPPGETPVVFAPGVVSNGHNHSRLAISPDGNQMCWTSASTLTAQGVPKILCVTREDGSWTIPQTPAFAAEGMTASPLFSPDGSKLFFDFTEDREKGWTTKYVERTASGWSAPKSDGVLLKTSSSFTKSSKVYFSDHLSGKTWNTGIYSAQYSAAGYSEPKALDAAINSPYIDYTPYISPDEAYLMFASSRPSTDGRTFLHISFRNSDGTWSPPRRLGDLIGFAGAARFPSISPDGRYLFFCGDDGNFYWADIKAVESLKTAQKTGETGLRPALDVTYIANAGSWSAPRERRC